MSGQAVVLTEEIDDDYEPTEQELKEYADWLGMDLEEDKDLLWIARRGLKAPLPHPWKPCQTQEDGEIFYFNFETGESVWDHPCDDYHRNLYERERAKKRGEAVDEGSQGEGEGSQSMSEGKEKKEKKAKKEKKEKKNKNDKQEKEKEKPADASKPPSWFPDDTTLDLISPRMSWLPKNMYQASKKTKNGTRLKCYLLLEEPSQRVRRFFHKSDVEKYLGVKLPTTSFKQEDRDSAKPEKRDTNEASLPRFPGPGAKRCKASPPTPQMPMPTTPIGPVTPRQMPRTPSNLPATPRQVPGTPRVPPAATPAPGTPKVGQGPFSRGAAPGTPRASSGMQTPVSAYMRAPPTPRVDGTVRGVDRTWGEAENKVLVKRFADKYNITEEAVLRVLKELECFFRDRTKQELELKFSSANAKSLAQKIGKEKYGFKADMQGQVPILKKPEQEKPARQDIPCTPGVPANPTTPEEAFEVKSEVKHSKRHKLEEEAEDHRRRAADCYVAQQLEAGKALEGLADKCMLQLSEIYRADGAEA
mmetsp:Transcript_35125/g.80415  ORF Transcript_35125/g.80415 Transcript_35125/m.80415 type:complete len:531 (+) Transcript_35125:48-1640(+)